MKGFTLGLAIVVSLCLVGCSRGDSEKIDKRILCDPHTKEAYFVKPGAGHTSVLVRVESADSLCEAK